MSRVTVGRHLVLAILLYISLDQSIAWLPGAFVFEASGSVESVQMSRVRHVTAIGPAFVPSCALS
jgi:hypothetical protein